jgi:hypothetical protein
LLESVSNYRSRWMMISRKENRIRLIGRLFFIFDSGFRICPWTKI